MVRRRHAYHQRRGDGAAGRGPHPRPQQQQQQLQLRVVDAAAHHPRSSLDLAGTASACSWLSMDDDLMSPVYPTADDADDTHRWRPEKARPGCSRPILSNSSVHHFECVGLCEDISLRRGRFCARSLASYIRSFSKFHECSSFWGHYVFGLSVCMCVRA